MFTIALATTACAPAAAQAWMPEPVQFTRDAATDGGGTRADLRTARRFDLVGLEWSGARRAHAELRVRLSSGRWTRWAHADPSDEGPDAGEGRGRAVGPPVWAGGANRVQVRLERPVRRLRLRFANTTGSATPAARRQTDERVEKSGAFGAQADPAPTAGPAKPSIVPRSSWGASRCRPRDTPSYGNLRVAYVHHTVSLNGYSRARAASMVLGICLFHRNGNGWDDIGYDFLVDRYGRVFEGRGGGADAPVIGAHTGGFNSESTGVAVLGTHTWSAPPRAAMRSLERLLAWKLSLHGVPATGRATVTSLGGPSTSHPFGARVKVNRISGHRDVNLTACPGAALYRRLPALRRAVARRQGALSSLTFEPGAAAGSLRRRAHRERPAVGARRRRSRRSAGGDPPADRGAGGAARGCGHGTRRELVGAAPRGNRSAGRARRVPRRRGARARRLEHGLRERRAADRARAELGIAAGRCDGRRRRDGAARARVA